LFGEIGELNFCMNNRRKLVIGNYHLIHGFLEGWYYEYKPTGEQIPCSQLQGRQGTVSRLTFLRWKKRFKNLWKRVSVREKRKAERLRLENIKIPTLKGANFPTINPSDIVGVQPLAEPLDPSESSKWEIRHKY
jgi:hypothetical protein